MSCGCHALMQDVSPALKGGRARCETGILAFYRPFEVTMRRSDAQHQVTRTIEGTRGALANRLDGMRGALAET